MSRRGILFCLAFVCLVSIAWGQEYYIVRPPGQAGPGEYTSIQAAIDDIKPPNDAIVEVYGDSSTFQYTYKEEVTVDDITNVDNVTIRVASGHTVTVDPPKGGDFNAFVITAGASTRVTIEGFIIQDTKQHGIELKGGNHTVKNCTFESGIAWAAIFVGVNSYNNTIVGNTIKSWGSKRSAIALDGDGLVANNQIFTVTVDYGIEINGASSYIYNNSIYVNVSGKNEVGTAIAVSSTDAHVIKNNAVYAVTNHEDATVYCIALPLGSTAICDYNCFRARSTDGLGSAYVGSFGGTAYSTLSDWQAGTGLDANSIEYYPGFALTEGGSDLHLSHHTLRAMGTYVSEVTTDVDGDSRDNPQTKPDIGCDEIVGTAGAILAGTYTVDSGGGGNYTTLQEAAAELRERGLAGDGPVTISVTGGTTYRANILLHDITNISSTNYLVFKNDTGSIITIDGSDLDERGFALWGSQASFVTIEGFHIQSVTREGIWVDSATDLTIKANTINNLPNSAIWLSNADNSQILRNRLYGVTGADQDGITIASGGTGISIVNNMIYNLPDGGAGIRASSVPVSAGLGVYFNSISVEADAGQTKHAIWWSGGDTTCLFRNNAIRISAVATAIASGLYRSAGGFDSNRNDLYRAGSGGEEYTGWWGGWQDTLSAWQTASGQDANSITQDPVWIDLENLHILNPTSPLIDSGIAVSGITEDYDGQGRDSFPDIGCDEWIETTGYVYTYEDDSVPIGGITVRMLVNGALSYTAVTDAQGAFNMGAPYAVNDSVLFFLDTDGVQQGATCTRASNTGILGLRIYRDIVTVRDETGLGSTNLNLVNALGTYSDADIPYTTSGNDVTISSGFSLLVKFGTSFTVSTGDEVVTPSFWVKSTNTLTVSSGAGVYWTGVSTVDGTLNLSGTSTAFATLAYSAVNNFLELTVSGTLDANYFRVDTGCISFDSGATIGALCNGQFEYTSGITRGAQDVYLDLSALGSADRLNLPGSFRALTFEGSNGKNIKASNTTPLLTVVGPSGGALWGEDYDEDPFERIWWETDVFARISGGNPVEYYDSIQDALSDPDVTDGTVIRCTRNVIISESIDLASSGKDVIIEDAVFQPDSGLAVYNSDSILRGTLRNCIILKGGVDYLTLQNCTLYRRSSTFPALQMTNSNVTNCIYEDDTSTGGSSLATSYSALDASIFNNIDLLDFHLKSTATAVIDAGTDLSASFTTDFEGHARGYDGDGDSIAEWDIGADEYRGTNVTPSINTDDLGNIRRIVFAGPRDVSGKWYAYLITAGSAANSVYDNRLMVLDLSDLSIVTDSGTPIGYLAPGPIMGISYHQVSWSSPYDRRIYISVDADNNGSAERVYALRDTGGTLSSSISIYSAFGGSGYQEYGVGPVNPLRVDLYPDYPPYNHRLFFVTESALGATQLYKVNIDWQDTDADANGVYGDTIWVSEAAPYEPRAFVSYDYVGKKLYVACSDDAVNNYVIVKLDSAGNVAPPILNSWANAGANQNRYGQTIIYHLIHCAPSNGNQVFSTTTSAASDERRWTSPALAGNIASRVFRFWATASLMVEAGQNVYKLKDSGADPAEADDGTQVDPDWPREIVGNVVGRITQLGGRIFWCSTGGWVYVSNYARWDNTTSGDEAYVSGYPFKFLGHRFKGFLIMPSTSASGLYFVTNQGGILKFPYPE